jgi:hypothetical protein
LEERIALSCSAGIGEIGKRRAKHAVVHKMQAEFYLLQQIEFSFCTLQGLQGEVPASIR